MKNTAKFSKFRKYRYALWRNWDEWLDAVPEDRLSSAVDNWRKQSVQ